MKIMKLVITILVLIALIGVGALVYTTCSGTPLVQRIDNTVPDSTVAPFEVSTYTHVYFVQRANMNEDGTVTMTGWYVRDGGKWVFHEESITLPVKLHPNISKR